MTTTLLAICEQSECWDNTDLCNMEYRSVFKLCGQQGRKGSIEIIAKEDFVQGNIYRIAVTPADE